MSGGQDVIRWGGLREVRYTRLVPRIGRLSRTLGLARNGSPRRNELGEGINGQKRKDGRNFKIPEREKLLDLTARMQVAAESM
jgi:hypothetical protein